MREDILAFDFSQTVTLKELNERITRIADYIVRSCLEQSLAEEKPTGCLTRLHRVNLNDAVRQLGLDLGELGFEYTLKDAIYEAVREHPAAKVMDEDRLHIGFFTSAAYIETIRMEETAVTIDIHYSDLFDSLEIYRMDSASDNGVETMDFNLLFCLRHRFPFQFDGKDLVCEGMRVQGGNAAALTISYVISLADDCTPPWTAVGPPVEEKYVREIYILLRQEEAKGKRGYLKGLAISHAPVFRDCNAEMNLPGYIYYSTQRPAGPGACPAFGENPVNVENYDERTPVEDGASRAWSVLTYSVPLTGRQIYEYELRPASGNPTQPPDRVK